MDLGNRGKGIKEFKVILKYSASSKLVWATWDPVSKNKTQKQSIRQIEEYEEKFSLEL